MLAEAAGAVARRSGDQYLALRTLKTRPRLPGLRLIKMKNALMMAAGTVAARPGLRGAEVVYVAAAERLDLPLCTLDEEQAQRSAYRIKVQYLAASASEETMA